MIFWADMDIDTIVDSYRHFQGRVGTSFGWGTNLTNDVRDCDPKESAGREPIALVCKLTRVDGQAAVQLSDNPAKATGDLAEVVRYLTIFGGADCAAAVVLV